MSAQRDWLGVWFAALRRGGEDVDIRFREVEVGGRGTAGEGPEVALPHEEIDGIGGLARVLEERGYAPDPPARGHAPRPRPIARATALWRELADSHPWSVRWRRFDRSRIQSGPGQNRPVARAYCALDRGQTERLRAGARARGVSINSLLLASLSASVSPRVLCEGERRLWLVPVNMRGLVPSSRRGNQVAQVPIEISEEGSAADVHRQVTRLLDEGRHFGAWDAMRLARLVGERGLDKRARSYLARPGHAWIGTFSNLGRWEATGLARDRSWVMFVPVTRSHPLGAACVTLNGCLGLTLQAYPALSIEPDRVAGWLRAWTDRLERDLG